MAIGGDGVKKHPGRTTKDGWHKNKKTGTSHKHERPGDKKDYKKK